ncbi:MAG: alanine racemase [Acidimicrobiia bacterium]|nr:alanine racemase [Acidimicrobiia bacterium]
MNYDPVMVDAETMRPTRVEIDLGAITANFRAIERHVAPAGVMPILKANAYGHGLLPIADHLQTIGAAEVGVAYLEEGLLLRHHGVEMDILVMGGLAGNQIPHFIDANLIITASSIDKLHQIDRVACDMKRRARVHLKIDTGMGRIGTQYYSASGLFDAMTETSNVDVEAVYSHFACSDDSDLTSARTQVARFEEALGYFAERDLPMPKRHMANSGAILNLRDARYDLVRPGILLYGVYPSDEVPRVIEVTPALSWLSRVAYFKVLKPGHSVSYGSTWTASKETRIVTVPVGYGDGYFRLLSNRGEVVIHGRRYPIRGRVCMDQFMVDIGSDAAFNGNDVILIGGDGDGRVSVEDVARWADTIPYEVLTNINTRVPRLYTGGI